jgi:hypothetical protein
MPRRFVAIALCCVGLAVRPASAEVLVHGSGDDLVVEARDASISDVALRLQSALGVEITVTGPPSHPISGTFAGSIRRVFSRMLVGTNFIVNSAPGRLSVVIIGSGTAGSNRLSPYGDSNAHWRVADETVSGQQGQNGPVFPKKQPPKTGSAQDANTGATSDNIAVRVSRSDFESAGTGSQGWNSTGGWKFLPPKQPAAKPGADAADNNAVPSSHSGFESAGTSQGWNSTGGWNLPPPKQPAAKPGSGALKDQPSAPSLPNQSMATMRALTLAPKSLKADDDR